MFSIIFDKQETYPSSFPSLSPHQALPLLCSEQQDALSFNADLQHLYAAVIARGNAQTRKRKLSEEERPPAKEPDLASSQGLFDLKSRELPADFLKLHSLQNIS